MLRAARSKTQHELWSVGPAARSSGGGGPSWSRPRPGVTAMPGERPQREAQRSPGDGTAWRAVLGWPSPSASHPGAVQPGWASSLHAAILGRKSRSCSAAACVRCTASSACFVHVSSAGKRGEHPVKHLEKLYVHMPSRWSHVSFFSPNR